MPYIYMTSEYMFISWLSLARVHDSCRCAVAVVIVARQMQLHCRHGRPYDGKKSQDDSHDMYRFVHVYLAQDLIEAQC